jgi:DNA-binding transcriptional LysR family regulator
VLTPRGEALRGPVRRALAALEETFRAPMGFDPGTAQRVFTIASTDFVGLIVMPKIWPLVAKHAPDVEIDVKTSSGAPTFESLRKGAFDLALGVPQGAARGNSS